MRSALTWTAGIAAALACALMLAIAFGGPSAPRPVPGIVEPFRKVDFLGMPPHQAYLSRTGEALVYREYVPHVPPVGIVVLIHGSAGHSVSMHPLARAFARAGYLVYVPDIRGHGASRPDEPLRRIGQLDEDLEDLVRATGIAGQATLVGFSSGGGFALRIAASERHDLFARYVLLAPYLSRESPTYRPQGGGWVSLGMPRMAAIAFLDAIGMRAFNDLAVVRFPLAEDSAKGISAEYSYAMAMNFRPPRDYAAAIRAVRQPMSLLVGADDELSQADQFLPLFQLLESNARVAVLPGINHTGLVLEEKALREIVGAVPR